MKVAAIIEYSGDKENLKTTWKTHREYLRCFLDNGKLVAAGPFGEDSGALWILVVETIQEADGIVKSDPFVAAGVIASWKIRPLAYWSAKESLGK